MDYLRMYVMEGWWPPDEKGHTSSRLAPSVPRVAQAYVCMIYEPWK